MDKGIHVIHHSLQHPLLGRPSLRQLQGTLDQIDDVGIGLRLLTGIDKAVDYLLQLIGIELLLFH